MKTYNETKTQEILNPDLTKGYLKPDKLLIKTIPAVEAIEEKWHYEDMPPDESGGHETRKVIDAPCVEGEPAEEIYEDIQVYVPYTAEEIESQYKSVALDISTHIANTKPLWRYN